MPPKKKRTTTNPVVGTVSTRSTRRQSVVNIEIPKLTRSNKPTAKVVKEPKRVSNKALSTSKATESFTEKIKKSYKKFIQPSKKISTHQKSQDTIDKDNRALLEILQDWDDTEEEEHALKSQTSLSRQNSVDKSLQSSSDYVETTSRYSDIKQIELALSGALGNEDLYHVQETNTEEVLQDTDEDSQNSKVDVTGEHFKLYETEDVNLETTKDENSTSMPESLISEQEELIIEEHASIPYADDALVNEQKSEEISTTEYDNNSKMSYEEDPEINISNEPENSESNSQFSEAAHMGGNISENSQLSNDLEETYINKNEESSSSLLTEQVTEMECTSVNQTEHQEYIDENCVQEEMKYLEVPQEDISNLEVPHKMVGNLEMQLGIREQTEIEVNNKMSSVSSYQFDEDKEEKMDSDTNSKEVMDVNTTTEGELGENLENKVAGINLSDINRNLTKEHKRKKSKNESSSDYMTKEDTSRRSSSTETSRRSSMEHITEKSSNSSSPVGKKHMEDISKKVSHLQLDTSKKQFTLAPLFLEDVANTTPIFKSKFRQKSKTKQITTLLKQNVEQEYTMTTKQKTPKTSKPPTFKITKEKKPKEPKSKKKSAGKKEKSESKDLEKVENKEKKNGKSDETNKNSNKAESEGDDENLRRSSRIKSISVLNKKTTGWGLVKSKSESSLFESDISDSNSFQAESEKSTPTASPKVGSKDRKWKPFNSSEAHYPNIKSDNHVTVLYKSHEDLNKRPHKDPVVEGRLKQFVHLKENQYRTDRMICKEAKKMVCDCFLTPEELDANEYGCGEDCLNRLLLIECGSLCTVNDRCTNKRFQKNAFAPVEVFNTDKKGLGLRAAANIPFGEFILEYVGEVLDTDEFDKRAEVYSQDKNIHYYFMALRADAVIDATMKGNISRFINHSCDPNAETQKWTVNGELRIGFFSTRTILAGEEITFDYRFQRYGKEAQKCYCGASICRGWLGEQPDSDEEEEEEEEEEIEETEEAKPSIATPDVKDQVIVGPEISVSEEIKAEIKDEIAEDITQEKDLKLEEPSQVQTTPVKLTPVKKKVQKKKPRIEMFEEVDQLNEEIEMLVTTGLKNQQHTLKLSRLMVRAKEPQQRAKLLRVLRRGELPCRRLFLDYHGLRFMHGYMIDAQQLVMTNKQFESLRLEVLQTLAILPIPNKSMLQDSKVLPTVEKWSTNKDLTSPPDSESNSPKTEGELTKSKESKTESKLPIKDESVPERSIEDQEEEIRFLASKLLEEWKNLKEVFRIPKKERIEQMKEHEREANKKFMQTNQNAYGSEDDKDKKAERFDRYRGLSRSKAERDFYSKKPSKPGDKPSAEFLRLSRIERRKLFALQHELKEEERKLKQREMWRQHEMNCMMIGADPRFTAPFDPNRGYQLIWNPQIGQWQNCSMPSSTRMFSSQHQPHAIPGMHQPHHLQIMNQPHPMQGINQPHQMQGMNQPHQMQGMNQPHQMQGMNQPLPMQGLNQPHQMQGLNQPHPMQGMNQAHQMQGMNQPHQMQGMNLPLPVHHLAKNLPTYPPYPSPHGIGAGQPPLPQVPPLPPNPHQGHIPLPQTAMPPLPTSMPPLPNAPMPQMSKQFEEDPSQVKFMGPIPPPVKLPPKWKCAKDKYGRPYYYHIKLRKSQWEPPPLPDPPEEQPENVLGDFIFPASESESSSDTSSVSSESSSDNSESDDDVDDTKLLLEVRRQMENLPKLISKPLLSVDTEESHNDPSLATPSPDEEKAFEGEMDVDDIIHRNLSIDEEVIRRPSIDMRLKELDIFKEDKPPKKKRRVGLCEEIIISPRTEEDKRQFKEDIKRYKANKEKLKRQKEKIIQQTKKQLREIEMKKIKDKRQKTTVKVKLKEKPDFNSEAAKKIKETFRTNMASTVVNSLNFYRKPDCTEGRITNTQDFKHLARKLTHFVMLKEMKHILRIEDLTCTDNVKMKAREFIRKYMSKFGEVYVKRSDSPDFKD